MAEEDGLGVDGIVAAIEAKTGDRRILVAIAGPPGAGKSTIADTLADRLEKRHPGGVAILPMDGYHFDDRVLDARGLRPRKGSPETFDVGGLAHMLARLRRNEEEEIAAPVFDRDLEIARAGARLIPRSVRIVIVEGNYLLLERAPWSALADSFDLSVMLAVPEDVLRERLTARWTGYDLGPEEVAAKLDGNDIPNGRTVLGESRPADIVVSG